MSFYCVSSYGILFQISLSVGLFLSKWKHIWNIKIFIYIFRKIYWLFLFWQLSIYLRLNFQVAMDREKFPEKIPFRLTRMLINAMEVTGIEGTYRRTCESVMSVLHRNKDSLMAVLEAFVYDPLLNWRLIETNYRNR